MKESYGVKNLEFIFICIGTVASLATIYTLPDQIQFIASSAMILIILFILGLRAYRKVTPRYTVVADSSNVNNYFVRYATFADLQDICNLQKEAYTAEDAVPVKLYQEWYEVNPDGFFVLEVSGKVNQVVGHLTLLAIKEERLNLYKSGLIRETEIRGCDLIPSGNKAEIKDLYVESFIIKKSHRKSGIPCIYRMMKNMVLSFCDPKVAKWVYAMAATGDGEKTIEGMKTVSGEKFNPVSIAVDRADSHNMYAVDFQDFLKIAETKESQFEFNMLHRRPNKTLQRTSR